MHLNNYHHVIKQIREIFINLGYAPKPDFMIIGAQKGGTSALFYILREHSHIKPSMKKEIHYFDQDKWYKEGKIKHYHSYFPLPFRQEENTKLFEATPSYLFHPEVPERLYRYNPDLKFILLLRAPAERAFSAWTMYHHHFREGKNVRLYDPRSFKKAISEEIENIETESYKENRIAYVKRGLYHLQIERYLKYFKKEQLLVLESKRLKDEPKATLKKGPGFYRGAH